MCAQYLIRAKLIEFAKKYGLIIGDDDQTFDERVVPYKLGPVVISDGKHNILKIMRFSLLPSWSKEPKVKFATHNARIETVAEKPTWKTPFKSRRCIIPISRFIEPIYINELAGNMVQFYPKDGSILSAAGIWDEWVDKKTGEVIDSFSIITDEPPEFIAKTGHDRCPVFLKEEAFAEWLDPKEKDPEELLKLLKSKNAVLDLTVEKDRPMAKGWEKRIPS